jgi:flagellar hook-basal body complex protein FliE
MGRGITVNILSNYDVKGDIVNLKVSRQNHISDKTIEEPKGDTVTESFKDLFNKALGEVNNLELKATDIANQFTIDPDSVNIHDVQIAAEQAEMSVMLTKGIMDRVIRAYKEIISVR